MSSIITKFTLGFENKEQLKYLYEGFKLHNSESNISSVKYFEPKSKDLSNFFKENENTYFHSLTTEDNSLINGVIEGGSVSYCPEALFQNLAQLGCNLSIVNNYYNGTAECETYAFKGASKVKPAAIIKALKKSYPSVAFKAAIVTENKKLAVELIESGVNPNILIEGRPAIEYAAWLNLTSVVQALIRNGADVNAVSPDIVIVDSPELYQFRMTALHHTVQRGTSSTLKLLLNNKADPNIPNTEGDTALHSIYNYRNENFTQLLLDSGASVNAENILGQTPLMYLISIGYETELNQDEIHKKIELIKLHISKGASVHKCCKHGGNLLWYFWGGYTSRNKKLPNFLKGLGLVSIQAPSNAYKSDCYENLETAISHNDINYINSNNLRNLPETNLTELANLARHLNRIEILKSITGNSAWN